MLIREIQTFLYNIFKKMKIKNSRRKIVAFYIEKKKEKIKKGENLEDK